MPPRNTNKVQTIQPKVNDSVNNPAHYAGSDDSFHDDIECIDAIAAMLGREGFIAFLRGQVLKYTWRLGRKGDAIEDCQKAGWYRQKLEDTLDGTY